MCINRYRLLAAPLMLNLLASWPHWRWMAQRANDGSDDPWGIVALLTIVALAWFDKTELRMPDRSTLASAAVLTLMGSAGWGVLPSIVAAAFASLSLVCLISGMLPKQRPMMPLLMLAILALPLAASLNFYLGYPLRWLCARATAQLLELFGLLATPQGAALLWNGQAILIDAPCAGIAMLWLGWYLAALFSYLNSSGVMRSCTNLALAGAVVVLGNVLRNTLLFYKESGLVRLPHWSHEAIGLFLFGLMVPVIYCLCTVQIKPAQIKSEHRHESV